MTTSKQEQRAGPQKEGRTETLKFRVSPAERITIEKLAHNGHECLADYLRDCALSRKPPRGTVAHRLLTRQNQLLVLSLNHLEALRKVSSAGSGTELVTSNYCLFAEFEDLIRQVLDCRRAYNKGGVAQTDHSEGVAEE